MNEITTGAHSGQPRSVPLIGIPHGELIILIASNWGRPLSPAWYYNLRANPTARVSVNGQTAVYTTREAEGVERGTCWQEAVDYYPAYETYQKGNGRCIPVMVLTVQENQATLSVGDGAAG